MSLTPRQQQIVSGIASGNTYKAIASDLGISAATVDFHVREIKRRLKVQTLPQIISALYKPVGNNADVVTS
jgi:two-component system, LuxR family, response regulator FixJ